MSFALSAVLTLLSVYIVASIISAIQNRGNKKEVTKHKYDKAYLNTLADKHNLSYTEATQTHVREIDGSFKLVKQSKTQYPEWSFGEEGVTIRCHKNVKTNIEQSLRAMGPSLYSKGYIPEQFLLLEITGIPGEHYLRYASASTVKLHDLLFQAGLLAKNSTGDLVRPTFKFENNTITLNVESLPLSINDIRGAVPIFNTLGDLTFSPDKITYENGVYALRGTPKIQLLFKKGESVVSNLTNFNEVIKNNFGNWVVGQDTRTGEILMFPFLERAHLGIIGMSGSGKTQLLKSILFSRLQSDPSTTILYFDGKSSSDFLYLNEVSSIYKSVAVIKETANPTSELSTIISYAWKTYEERKKLLSDAGCSNFAEYNLKNPDNKISPLIVVFEEAPVLFSNFLSYESEMDIPNTTSNRIKRLLNESRSVSINFCFCAQGADKSFLPSQISKNLLLLLGKSGVQTANYLNIPELVSLNKSFILSNEGNNVEFNSFYLGSDTEVQNLINNLNIPKKIKIEYDANQIMYKGNEKSRAEILNLLTNIIFKTYSRTPSANPESDDLLLTAKSKSQELDTIILSKDEFYPDYINKLLAKTPSKFALIILEYDIAGAFFSKSAIETSLKLIKPVVFMSLSQVLKKVGQAYSSGNSDSIVSEIFDELDQMQEKLGETSLDLGVDVAETPKSSNSTTNYNAQEALASIKEVSVKEYNRICNLQGSTPQQRQKKGRALEAFCAKLLMITNEGTTALIGDEAAKLMAPLGLYGDGGIDVLLIENKSNENKKVVHLVQVKNYANSSVSKESLTSFAFGKTIAEAANFEVRSMLLLTNSELTSDAVICAELAGIKCVTSGALLEQVRLAEAKTKKKPGRPKSQKAA